MPFLILVTLTFDLDLQTRSSEVPNTSSANSFSGYRDISYTNKKTQTDGGKNRTFRLLQFTVCGNSLN